MQQAEIIQKAKKSVTWSMLGMIIPRFITPITTILLGALLLPSDFGVVAISNAVISFAQVVVAVGWAQAIVQTRDNLEDTVNASFWVSMSMVTVLYTLLWFAAPVIAVLYENPIMTDVLRVSGLNLFLYAITDIARALLERDLRFRNLFWVQSMPLIIGAVISVIWAALGGGVWALVIGPLIGTILRTLLSWGSTRWLPKFSLNRVALRSMIRFGSWVFISQLLMWMLVYADNIVAGLFLPLSDVGVYALGYSLSTLLTAAVGSALSSVAFPAFAALQAAPQKVGEGLLKLQSRAASVIFPMSFGISAVAAPVIALIYGDRWIGLSFVIQVLSVTLGLTHIWSFSGDAYRAINRPDTWTKVMGASVLILFAVLIAAGSYGLHVYILARGFGNLFVIIFSIVTTRQLFKISMRRQVEAFAAPFMASVGMYAALMLINAQIGVLQGVSGVLLVGVLIALGAAIYLGLLRLFSREKFDALLAYAVGLVRRRA